MSMNLDTQTLEPRGTSGLSETDRHRLLADEQRRLVIDVVAGRRLPVDLSTLARTVAARESGVDETDDRAVDRVAVELHHRHLPKLADAGVVDYDADAHRVETCRLAREGLGRADRA